MACRLLIDGMLVPARIATIGRDAIDAVRFAAGWTIVAGVFVTVQTLLLVEHVWTHGAGRRAEARP